MEYRANTYLTLFQPQSQSANGAIVATGFRCKCTVDTVHKASLNVSNAVFWHWEIFNIPLFWKVFTQSTDSYNMYLLIFVFKRKEKAFYERYLCNKKLNWTAGVVFFLLLYCWSPFLFKITLLHQCAFKAIYSLKVVSTTWKSSKLDTMCSTNTKMLSMSASIAGEMSCTQMWQYPGVLCNTAVFFFLHHHQQFLLC